MLKHTISQILLICMLPAAAQAICGSVVDDNGLLVSGALVRVQNTKIYTISNSNGEYCLEVPKQNKNVLTAWASGYYIGGVEPDKSGSDIALKPLPKKDHISYEWKASVKNQLQGDITETEPCQQCHEQLVEEWTGDVHGTSHNNPLFKNIFSGQPSGDEFHRRPRFLSDFPGAKNSCKVCHQPVAENRAIECDFCHKVLKVDTSPSLLLGRERMQFLRPAEQELFLGSLDDVYQRDDSFHPLYQSSDFCASCHQGRFWNTDVYSDYQEWLASPYQAEGVQCQDCHMKNKDRFLSADKEKEGLVRDVASLANHDFRITNEILKASIKLEVSFERQQGKVAVDIVVKNITAGHHVPGGSPLRHLVMIVDVSDENNNALQQLSGSVLPEWLTREGEYRANQPGKVFAKLLKDAVNYSSQLHTRKFTPMFPAPFWRPTILHKDNRIPARSQNETHFLFEGSKSPVAVSVKLYYRNIFKHWVRVNDNLFYQVLLAEFSNQEIFNE